MTAVLTWLNQCFGWLYTALGWLLDGLIVVLNYFICTLVDGILTMALTFIQALNFASMAFNMATYWGLMPDQALWFVTQLGIPTGLSMIGVAYSIRFCLNLIPSIITRI